MFYPPLPRVQLSSVSPAHGLPMGAAAHRTRPGRADKKEISWQAVYYHFRKWSQDGSLEHLWQHSVTEIRDDLDLSHVNLDGSHALAKKGGESVAYQGRKKAKTSNIGSVPVTGTSRFFEYQ